MKKVLLQLDTEEHPSPFDAIVAHDAGVDVLLSHSGVKPEVTRALAQDAFFTRGPDDLKNDGRVGRRQERVRRRGDLRPGAEGVLRPLPVSVMIDSNGCNTTAATTIARIAKARDLTGDRAVVIGVGAVGLRSAMLLAEEGCEVLCRDAPARPVRRRSPTPHSARPRGRESARSSTSTSRATGPSSRGCSTERRSSCQPGPPAWRCCGRTSGPRTIDRAAGRLQRGGAAGPRGHEGDRRPRRLRRQARARRAGDRRAEDEGAQDLRAAAVREQRPGARHRGRVCDRQGARLSRDGPRVAGVDPGTFSFDVCVLDDGEVMLERSFPTEEVGADPAPLVEALVEHGPFDARPRPGRLRAAARPRRRRSASASSR